MSHFPRALLGRAARPAWACSLHLLTAPKKQPQLQRKQMGGWNLFSTHLIKRQGRSWMHWPLISHLFLCLTECQSLSKGLEKSFHHKKKVAQKWWREIKHPISSCWKTRATRGKVWKRHFHLLDPCCLPSLPQCSTSQGLWLNGISAPPSLSQLVTADRASG